MASRKQRRKARLRASTRSARRSSTDYLQLARQALAEDNGRKALDVLKRAKKSQSAGEGLDALLYCAAICRGRNLSAKDMHKEAAAMQAQAAEYRVAVNVTELAPDDLRLFLASLEPADAMATYAEHALEGSRIERAERILADRLVVEGCWDALAAMDLEHPFRRDAESAKSGIKAMERGDWTNAAEVFRMVGRRSPFAPWRLFCKAMIHFGEEDDESLQRAIAQLPDDFVMAGTVAAWKDPEGGSAPVRTILGLAGGQRRAQARELAETLDDGGPPRRIASAVARLARYLLPERPEEAYLDLLQIAALASRGRRLSADTVADAARILLPGERADAAIARMQLLVHHAAQLELDAGVALKVIDSLAAEYPEPGDRRIARGSVLESMARTALELRGWIGYSRREEVEFQRLMGHKIADVRWLSVELLEASLRADPDNRQGYKFLNELIRRGAPTKGRIESLLARMASRFPRDPAPLLELASNYYSRNAYRKAEDVLAEAARRAPHDERILDLQAIGFLKSATQGAKAGRSGRARSDLESAATMQRPLLSAVVSAKRILLDLMEGKGSAGVILSDIVNDLPSLEQLQVLLLLILEYSQNERHKRYLEEDLDAIQQALAARQHLVLELDPDDKMCLLRPLPVEFRVLYRPRGIAGFAADGLPGLLPSLNEDRFLEAIDLLLECYRRRSIVQEIDKRLARSPRQETQAMLRFYRAVIEMTMSGSKDPVHVIEVVNAADPPLLERLQAAAQRLSRYAYGDLSEALRRFDFSLLVPLPVFPDALDALDDLSIPQDFLDEEGHLLDSVIDDEEALQDDNDEPADLSDIDMHDVVHFLVDEAEEHRRNPRRGLSFERQIAMLEGALQECGWAGFAPADLKKGVEELRSCSVVARYLSSLAKQCAQNDMRDVLSPAANVLLHWGSTRRERSSRRR